MWTTIESVALELVRSSRSSDDLAGLARMLDEFDVTRKLIRIRGELGELLEPAVGPDELEFRSEHRDRWTGEYDEPAP